MCNILPANSIIFSRCYTLKFRNEDEYHEWRELLYFVTGDDATAAAAAAAQDLAMSNGRMGGVGGVGAGRKESLSGSGRAGAGGLKEDAFSRAEATSGSGGALAGGVGGVSGSNSAALLHPIGGAAALGGGGVVGAGVSNNNSKVDSKYDTEATKKFARLLRKDEKVSRSGQLHKMK